MNLPGPYQRIEARFEGRKGKAPLPIAFRSRPPLASGSHAQPETASPALKATGESELQSAARWKASVWDEVQATADGTLRRHIRILITDGTQPGPEETAWG